MSLLIFLSSAFLVSFVLMQVYIKWKVPLEAWRHKHFGTTERWTR
jgi:hypothetical protein